MTIEELKDMHGREPCHICGKPRWDTGAPTCSYPHGMIPSKQVSDNMWEWEFPEVTSH